MSYILYAQDGSSTSARWSRWPGGGVSAGINVATLRIVGRYATSNSTTAEAPSSADV